MCVSVCVYIYINVYDFHIFVDHNNNNNGNIYTGKSMYGRRFQFTAVRVVVNIWKG